MKLLSLNTTLISMKFVINENIHDNYVDYSKIKTSIRDVLGRYLCNQTGNKPMIISVLQEI